MCDVLVYIMKKEPATVNVVNAKLFEHVLKEPHSWGFLGVTAEGKVRVIKSLSREEYVRKVANLDDLFWLMVFHGRTASAGKVSLELAHPIVYKKRFFLVHNGHDYKLANLVSSLSDTYLACVLAGSLVEQGKEKEAEELIKSVEGFKVFLYKTEAGPWKLIIHSDGIYDFRKTRSYVVISKDISAKPLKSATGLVDEHGWHGLRIRKGSRPVQIYTAWDWYYYKRPDVFPGYIDEGEDE